MVDAHPNIIRLNSVLNFGRRGGETAPVELGSRSCQHSVLVVSARVAKDQSGNGRAVTLLGRGSQLANPAKIRTLAHYAAGDLHDVQLKISRRQQLRYSATIEVV